MYNLLIVDDERVIVDSIAGDIPWEDSGITGIFSAYSGKEALAVLADVRIDIVLSDIKMPELTGVDLAKEIHRCYPHTKVIFMTGFDRFEYAQQALAHGVFRYLLKPISNQDLVATVEAALAALCVELERDKSYADFEIQLSAAIPVMHNRFLYNWIVKGFIKNRLEIENQLTGYQLPLDPEQTYMLVKAQIDSPLSPSQKTETLRIPIKNLVAKLLFPSQSIVSFDLDFAQMFLVAIEDEISMVKVMQDCEKMWELFENTLLRTTGVVLSVFVLPERYTIQELHSAYQTLELKIARFPPLNAGMLNILNSHETIRSFYQISQLEAYPSFSSLVLSRNFDAVSRLEEIFSEINQQGECSAEDMLELYFLVAKVLLNFSKKCDLHLESWAGNLEPYFYNYKKFSCARDIQVWCCEATKTLITYVFSRQQDTLYSVVEKAKEKIRQIIHENISVTSLADSLYISPSHLTRIFKKATGLSVSDYIIAEKMKVAKTMLKRPGAKVYTVANELGYVSTTYFNRLFKREVGMTPKEFQTKL